MAASGLKESPYPSTGLDPASAFLFILAIRHSGFNKNFPRVDRHAYAHHTLHDTSTLKANGLGSSGIHPIPKCPIHTAGVVKEYSLDVHTAGGGGKEYSLHVHTAGGGGKEYSLHVHTAGGGGKAYSLHPATGVVLAVLC
jgi:hypothetical protein